MKSREKLIPNIIGLSVDDAKEQLDKYNISYKKEIKTVLSFKKRGTIVKTNPDNLSENKKGEEVELYQSSGVLILIIPFFVALNP
jgi:beta-lactam-binding protein with PASTA domain